MTAIALLVAIALSAQGKPNFSGKWAREEAPPAAAGAAGADAGQRRAGGPPMGGGGGAGFSCGGMCTIAQDATSLKVDRAQGNQTFASTFKLDGTESKNQMPGQGGMTDVITVAKWDGNKITFTTKRQLQGTTVTSVQTVSMDGANLVVESSVDRGQGPQVGPKVTYKKQ
jgi:hypothetical protein